MTRKATGNRPAAPRLRLRLPVRLPWPLRPRLPLHLSVLAATGLGALQLLQPAHGAAPGAAPRAQVKTAPKKQVQKQAQKEARPSARKARTQAPAPALPQAAAIPRPSAASLAVHPGERLSAWLLRQPDPEAHANPALMWLVPQEEFPQRHLKNSLIVALEGSLAATQSPVQRSRQERLLAWLHSLPVTGRVALGIVDARWLQANPKQDPVLAPGQRLRPARWPLQTVTVVRPDGQLCPVRHQPGRSVPEYLRACGLSLRADHAWIAQPDGRTSRMDIDIGAWGAATADEPMPGAWIWAPPRAMADLTHISEGLIKLLATQGPSPQPAAAAAPGPAAAKAAGARAAAEPKKRKPRPAAAPAPGAQPDRAPGEMPDEGPGPHRPRMPERLPERPPDRAPSMPVAGPATATDNRRTLPVPPVVDLPLSDPPDANAPAAASPAVPAPVVPAPTASGRDAHQPPLPGALAARAHAQRATLQQQQPPQHGQPYKRLRIADAQAWTGVADADLAPVSAHTPAAPASWATTAKRLKSKTKWRVTHIAPHRGVLHVWASNAHADRDAKTERATAVLHAAAPADIHHFVLHFSHRGIPMHTHVVNRAEWVARETRALPPHEARKPVSQAYAPVAHSAGPAQAQAQALQAGPRQPADAAHTTHATDSAAPVAAPPASDAVWTAPPASRFSFGVAPSIGAIAGHPGSAVLAQAGVQAAGEFRISERTWVSGQLNLRLADNFDKFTHAKLSSLPRVRSHQREYATTRHLTIPTLQLTHVGQLAPNHYYSVYAGLLEGMYAGVGAEWLYRPWRGPVAFGVDVNRVRQRAFAQDFGLRDYKATTGHATLYWDTGFHGMQAKISAGQYLAGDRGMTLDISKRLDNGMVLGAYATKTNASSRPFGENGFDKGVYLSIPLDALLPGSSRRSVQLVGRSRTRDGGAMLDRAYPLHSLTATRGPQAFEPRRPADEVPRAGDNILQFNDKGR